MLFLNINGKEEIGISYFFKEEWLNRPVKIITGLFSLRFSSNHHIWDEADFVVPVKHQLATSIEINDFKIIFFDGSIKGNAGEHFWIAPEKYSFQSQLENISFEKRFWGLIMKEASDDDSEINVEYFESLFRISFDNHIIDRHLFTFIYNFEYAQKDGKGKTMQPAKAYVTKFNIPDNLRFSFLKKIDSNLSLINDSKIKNRLKLSLSWFSKNVNSISIDKFIYSWIAIETLTMSKGDDLKSLKNIISKAYSISIDIVNENFEIGKIYGLRCKIFHDGFAPKMDYVFLHFCDLLYIDIVHEFLGVECQKLALNLLNKSQYSLSLFFNNIYKQ